MIARMGYEHILVDVEPPIATVTLNRPKVLNALSPELIREVNEALHELDADDRVKAVVLTGGEYLGTACQDDGAHAAVGVELRQRTCQLADQVRAERVQNLRAVERDGRDRRLDFDQDVLVPHRALSSAKCLHGPRRRWRRREIWGSRRPRC